MTAGEGAKAATIRIVIAEDQAIVRRGAALLLSMEPDMEVVGQARNGVEAVELAQLLHPDVVLMDLHMPLKGGVAATREITQALPGTQILVLTTLDDDETVFEAVCAGAHAYLLKDADEDELLETVRALKRGESRLTPQIARKVMDQFRRLAAGARAQPAPEQACAAPAAEIRPTARGDALSAEPLTEKEEKSSAAPLRGDEQPADRQRAVSCRRHREELCQPNHGKASRQHADRTCGTVPKAVAARNRRVFPVAPADFASRGGATCGSPMRRRQRRMRMT